SASLRSIPACGFRSTTAATCWSAASAPTGSAGACRPKAGTDFGTTTCGRQTSEAHRLSLLEREALQKETGNQGQPGRGPTLPVPNDRVQEPALPQRVGSAFFGGTKRLPVARCTLSAPQAPDF